LESGEEEECEEEIEEEIVEEGELEMEEAESEQSHKSISTKQHNFGSSHDLDEQDDIVQSGAEGVD
jgi:hypothetical protein